MENVEFSLSQLERTTIRFLEMLKWDEYTVHIQDMDTMIKSLLCILQKKKRVFLCADFFRKFTCFFKFPKKCDFLHTRAKAKAKF